MRKMQILPWGSILHMLGFLSSVTQVRVHASENMEQREHSSVAGGSVNLCSYNGNQHGDSSERMEFI